jgi:branched-chain amino acid transport system permease protein
MSPTEGLHGDRAHGVGLALVVLGIVAIAILPAFAGNYAVRVATTLCLFVTMSLSWNFIGGYTGYPSFATAAFLGFGAYTGAILQTRGVPMPAAWLAATVVTAAFSALVGLAILRLRGHYFAVGSFAVLELVKLAASSWTGLTGGGTGLNVPILPGGPDDIARVFLYAMLGLAVLTFGVALAVERSRLGFGLRCIRQNESAAGMLGVNVYLSKIAAFVLSAAFVGAGGAIYASWVSYIDPADSFSILLTIKVPVMVLLGGAGTLFGPIVGAVAFQLLEEKIWSSFLEVHAGVLGLVIVLLVFVLPGGLLRLPARLARVPGGRQGRPA